MTERVLIIGSGIAGLSAAWLLSRKYDVVLIERDHRLGGHTHTHTCTDDTAPQGRVDLDTGFLVHNNRTYPLLVRLFTELGVACQDSDMSFAVSSRSPDFEYSTRNLNGLFAQRSNLLRPGHFRLVAELLRFGRVAPVVLTTHSMASVSLGDFLDTHKFSHEFRERYLYPMASAVWSAPTSSLRGFPAHTLIQFFYNHGMLSITDHPVWRVVTGGSHRYIERLLTNRSIDVLSGTAAERVVRTTSGVTVSCAGGRVYTGSHVVFACHGDEVLPLLAEPTEREREVLSAFTTSINDTWLHTDASFLPRRRGARASWNALVGETDAACLTYDLNRLQRLQTARQYCVTLNPARPIAAGHVLARMTYRHPLYTTDAVKAQGRWAEISGGHRTHFCGAYWFYGFHEDGLRSAVRVAEALGVTW